MTQEEIYDELYKKYAEVLPGMLHGSGGLPDAKGPGTSDVDVCVRHEDHQSLAKYFPEDTGVDFAPGRTVYVLKGYDREVNIYCTDGDWWDNGARHRRTELALRKKFPELAARAFLLKKKGDLSTEKVWAEILGLGEDYFEQLYDTEKMVELASKIG